MRIERLRVLSSIPHSSFSIHRSSIIIATADAHTLAVQLAERACGGKVRDSIRLTKVKYDTYSPAKSSEVFRSAATAVGEVLGSRTKGIEVKASDDGTVTLGGSVASWQD